MWTKGNSSSSVESSFEGNTTTRDKVIRRESRLKKVGLQLAFWELSLQRLNQLRYFEPLKPDDPNVTEKTLDEKTGQVDLTLKVMKKERTYRPQGGVSGLEGAFIGLNYSTNNFLGKVKPCRYRSASALGSETVMFGFTQPYMFDRPCSSGSPSSAIKLATIRLASCRIFSPAATESAQRRCCRICRTIRSQAWILLIAQLSPAALV